MILKNMANLALLSAMVALAACTIKVNNDDDDAGTSGAGGSSGASVTGGSAGTSGGAADTTDAGGASGTAVSGGDGDTTMTGSTGGGGAATGSALVELCGDAGVEAVANDDREHASKVIVGTPVKGCLQSGTDIDFYEFTAPVTPVQGGYFQIQVTDVGSKGDASLKVYAANDNGEVVGTAASGAGSMFVWFAAQPATTFRAAVTKYVAASPYTPYLFTAKFTGVPDTNEPNDDLDHPTPITTNTDVSGYLFAGLRDSTNPPSTAGNDYFKVALTTAPATITLRPPADADAHLELRNEAGSTLMTDSEASAGGSAVITYTPTAAGNFYVIASTYIVHAYHGTGSTVPVYYTTPYKLTVAQ